MNDEIKEPCRRCLLKDFDKGEAFERVKRAVNRIKPHEKTSDEDYSARLEICKNCDFLLDGTCLKCGCYVELRAAFKKNRCPLAGTKRKW